MCLVHEWKSVCILIVSELCATSLSCRIDAYENR